MRLVLAATFRGVITVTEDVGASDMPARNCANGRRQALGAVLYRTFISLMRVHLAGY
jgi:hypothetical protein